MSKKYHTNLQNVGNSAALVGGFTLGLPNGIMPEMSASMSSRGFFPHDLPSTFFGKEKVMQEHAARRRTVRMM